MFSFDTCQPVVRHLQVNAPRRGGRLFSKQSHMQRPGTSVFLHLRLLQQAGGRPIGRNIHHDVTVSSRSVTSPHIQTLRPHSGSVCRFAGYRAGVCTLGEEVVMALIVLFSPVPTALLLIGMVFFRSYPINERKSLRLQESLATVQ